MGWDLPITVRSLYRRYYGVDERIELWGLQIPHNSARPQLEEVVDPADAEKAAAAAAGGASAAKAADVITWTSVDRLNMSIGLLYALSNLAVDQGIRWGQWAGSSESLTFVWLALQASGSSISQVSSLRLFCCPSMRCHESCPDLADLCAAVGSVFPGPSSSSAGFRPVCA